MNLEKQYTLNRAGIDAVSEELTEWLRKADISQDNAIRIRITMEELLLRVLEHYGEVMTGTLLMRKRFGRPTLQFSYRGEAFDPIHQDGDEEDELIRQMLTRLGLVPEWRYRKGINELILRGPGRSIRTEFLLAGAGIAAILFGIAAGRFPGAVRAPLMDYLLNPVSDAFLNGLNTFVGLMIFLSVVSGICSIGNIADFSKMGKYVILRQIRLTFFFAAAAMAVVPLFGITFGQTAGGASQISVIVEILFSIIPSDPITPFAEKNMLQIIFMAVMTGTGLLILEDRSEKIRTFIAQAVDLFTEIISIVCRFLPVYIFTSMAAFVIGNGVGVFVRLWKPIILNLVMCVLFMAGKILYTALKYHVPAVQLMKKVQEPVLTGLFTASSSAAYGQMVNTLDRKLGVAPSFYRFALPFINLLAGETTATSIIVIICYLTEMEGASVNFTWLLTVWFMSSVFSMAMPPVSGAFLVCIGAIMAQLGMGDSGIAVAGLLGIICDFVSTGTRIGMELMELVQQADHVHKLDRKILEGSK